MSEHDARLAPSALLGITACALVVTGTVSWLVTAGGLALIASLSVLVALLAARVPSGKRDRLRVVAAATAFACTAAAVMVVGAGLRLDARNPPELREAMASGYRSHVDGVVLSDARVARADQFTQEDRWWVRVEAHRVVGTAVRTPMYVAVTDPQGLVSGASVHLEGTLAPALNSRDTAALWDAEVLHVEAPGGVNEAVSRARQNFRELVDPLPVRQKALTAGMVIGDDSTMPPEQTEQMRRSGLAHLTAVSGAHFAVLALVTMWCVRRARLPRCVQATMVALVAAGFTMLVGPEPSVVRAASMAFVMALALVLGRRARAVAALSAGIIVLLTIDPWVATSLGFCLSVVAVAAIAVWLPHLAARLERWFMPRFARLVAVPISAAVVTAPLLVMIAGGVGTYVVAANLVAAPFAAPVTIVGLVALAVAEPLPWLGYALVSVAATLVTPVDVAARAFSSAPGAWLPWPPTAVSAASLAAVAALLIAATVSLRVRGWGMAAVALLCALSLSAPTVLTAVSTPRMRDWEVVACDVGQGDMMLLRSAPDSAVVIDVGASGSGGEQCLRRYGVQRIELLIVTHPDADHDGDIAAVLASVPVTAAWISPVAADAPSTRLLERRGVAVTVVGAGTEARAGSVHLRVLGPGSAAGAVSDNEASVVVLAQAGGTSVLALGDVEQEGQRRLVASLPRQLVVDVIKIAHHGSGNQHDALAGRLTGRVGIVSVGAANSYGHPHPRTLDLYRPRTSVLLRTDQCGDILMASAPVFRFASRCPANVAG